jgi:hypothetical protein
MQMSNFGRNGSRDQTRERRAPWERQKHSKSSRELLTSYPVTPKMNRASFNEPEAINQLAQTIR